MRTSRAVPWIAVPSRAVASAVAVVLVLSGCGGGSDASRPAPKASPILLGTDGHGVSVDRRVGLTFNFDRSAAGRYRQVAGRRVLMECDQVSRGSDTQLLLDTSSARGEVRAPRHRAAIDTGFGGRSDFCRLELPLRNNKVRVVATVALTTIGYDYVDQQHVAQDIVGLAFLPPGLVARYGQDALHAAGGVKLPSEGATPPAGRLGLYVSGTHRYVAKRDRAGVLLFFQQDGGVTRTNMLGLLTDPSALGPNAQGIEQRQS
ncbi:MAG: hypothetical protein ACXVUE_20175 [Solirubrobacteraceae bacterium]